MPPAIASLELTGQTATSATFHIHDEDKKDKDEYNKWLVVHPFAGDGTPLSPLYQGIRWDEQNPPSDDCDMTVDLDPAASSFAAFVAMFPDVWTPRSNLVEFSAA